MLICLSQRLLIARARHRHTLRQAAETAGVAYSTWKRAERSGVEHMQAQTIARVAEYIGCDVADLIDGQQYGATEAGPATTAPNGSGVAGE